MCDVPSIAVFCSESIECFPGTGSKFFLKLLVTIPVATIITGTIVHFRFHIRRISIHKLSYFNFFSASFCASFLSAGIATSISVHVFSIIIIIIIIEFRPPFPWHYPPINHGLRVVLQTMNMELGLKMWGQLEELIWRGLGSRVPWKVFG